MALLATITHTGWKKRQAWTTDTSWWGTNSLRFCVGTDSGNHYVGKFRFTMPSNSTQPYHYAIVAIDTSTSTSSPKGVIGKLFEDDPNNVIDTDSSYGCRPCDIHGGTGISSSYIYSDEACTTRIDSSINNGGLVYAKFDISNCTANTVYAFCFCQSTLGTGSIWGDLAAASSDFIKIYTRDDYTITFNSNGGSTPSSSTKIVTYGQTYGTLPTVTKTGYTFAGWYTAAFGGDQITSDSTVNITSNQTLYAHWTINSYDFKIDPNNGKRKSDNSTNIITVSKNYGQQETITERIRTGYTLTGYTLTNTSNGSATDIGGAELTFDSTNKTAIFTQGSVAVTATAEWTANKYTITFNTGEGQFADGSTSSSTPSNPSVTYDGANWWNISGNYMPSRLGYDFLGWYDNSNNQVYDAAGACVTGTYWSDKKTWKYDNNLILTAHWAKKNNIAIKQPNGSYKYGVFYIKINGEYKPAITYIKTSNGYKTL